MLRTLHSESKFVASKTFFFPHTSLQQYLFEVFVQIFLTIIGTQLSAGKKKTWISWTKAGNIFVLNSVTDITNTSSSSFSKLTELFL